jgi:AcrR family transcriptional regulator
VATTLDARTDARTDGRSRRRARNRDAIVGAILECYRAGVLRPTAVEVAERAGVSVRSVHNHFADMESLRAEVADQQWVRLSPLAERVPTDGPLDARIAALLDARAALFEAAAPVRRAAVLARHESPTIARNLARAERRLRGQLELVFAAELGEMPGDVRGEVLDALDVLTSWEAWERARTLQRLSPAAARRALAHAAGALLTAPPTRPHGPGSGPGERGASR